MNIVRCDLSLITNCFEEMSMNNKNTRKECEELWAKNKYYVLSKSHKIYLEIREYLKSEEVDILFIYKKIEEINSMKESKKINSPFSFLYVFSSILSGFSIMLLIILITS